MKKIIVTFCSATILLACNNAGEKSSTTTTDSVTTVTTTNSNVTEDKATTPASAPDSATKMKNWQAYMTPGDVHKMMASWNGTWNGEVTMWEGPDAPPQTTKVLTTNKMAMGGRYQIATSTGNMMGMPFEGMSTLAYDNTKKAFVNTWIDNMGTGMMVFEGTWDEASKTINLKGKGLDPMDGREKDMRQILKIVDDKTQLMEMFCTGPDGKEFKGMEIKYTRK